jgi:hypothetical protein
MADNDDRFNRGTDYTTRTTDTEHMHPLHEERKKGPNWLWLLVPLILGLLVLPNMFRGDDQRATETTQREEVASRDNAITYNGQRWVVSGNAQAFPAGQMRQVATTADGQALYSNTQAGGGGGQATTATAERLYLRASDGRYVPLMRD